MRNNLKKERIKKGYTQKQLANLLNISLLTYYRYEHGSRDIKGDTLIKLTEIFGYNTESKKLKYLFLNHNIK